MSAVVVEERWCNSWPEDWSRYRRIDVGGTSRHVRGHRYDHYPDWIERGSEICSAKYVLYLEAPDGKDAIALLTTAP